MVSSFCSHVSFLQWMFENLTAILMVVELLRKIECRWQYVIYSHKIWKAVSSCFSCFLRKVFFRLSHMVQMFTWAAMLCYSPSEQSQVVACVIFIFAYSLRGINRGLSVTAVRIFKCSGPEQGHEVQLIETSNWATFSFSPVSAVTYSTLPLENAISAIKAGASVAEPYK